MASLKLPVSSHTLNSNSQPINSTNLLLPIRLAEFRALGSFYADALERAIDGDLYQAICQVIADDLARIGSRMPDAQLLVPFLRHAYPGVKLTALLCQGGEHV